MKPIQIALSCLIGSLLLSFTSAAEPVWKLDGKTIWSREPGTATFQREGESYRVEHSGEKDWAVSLCNSIPVEPGETFRISGTLQIEGKGSGGLTVGVFDGESKIVDWLLGNATRRGAFEFQAVSSEFVVPRGCATILPRITGHGPAKVVMADLKLEKLDKIALLDPVAEVAGTIELVSAPDKSFSKSLVFKGPNFSSDRGQKPSVSLDTAQTYEDKSTWRVVARDGLAFNLQPLEPFKTTPGDRIFIALRINLERGRPNLVVYPWVQGLQGKTTIATGTFRPDPSEEGGKWCCIHLYLTVPEGIDGIVPAVFCPEGAVFNVTSWTLSRPSDEELNPKRSKVEGHAKQRREEAIDRGLTAVRSDRSENGGVYLSWRLLNTDKPGDGFDVYRVDADGKEKKLNEKPVVKTTDFTDQDAANDSGLRWVVRLSGKDKQAVAYESDKVAASDKPYRSIPLKNEKSFDRIALADLDGDGRLDFVIKTPNANIDPYYCYWHKSPGPYKLQGYKSDGTFMWEYDLGWGIEQGIWYSPYLVADLDGDGCAEIAVKTCPGDYRDQNGRVYSGPEHLSILDGKTGKERARLDWPERDGLPYNLSSRHQLAVAYLDGKTPCLIALRGTYSRMEAVAYQFLTSPDRLEKLWGWSNRWERELGRWGQGAHTTHVFDLDGDGRDEIILGSIALDDDGSVLWEQKLGHPDHVYLGDIDPERPGLEIVYGIETRQNKNGVCMVDAKTGQLIWGHDQPTKHIHAAGMVSDIDARYPGAETWNGEQDSEQDRWLRDAKGKVLELPSEFSTRDLAPKSVWWDGGLQRKLIRGNQPVDYPTFKPVGETRFEGSVRLIADVTGDWREEVITSCDGEIRIYTTTIPAKDRRTTFLQDRNYRSTMIESTMGYWQVPLPGYHLKPAP